MVEMPGMFPIYIPGIFPFLVPGCFPVFAALVVSLVVSHTGLPASDMGCLYLVVVVVQAVMVEMPGICPIYIPGIFPFLVPGFFPVFAALVVSLVVGPTGLPASDMGCLYLVVVVVQTVMVEMPGIFPIYIPGIFPFLVPGFFPVFAALFVSLV